VGVFYAKSVHFCAVLASCLVFYKTRYALPPLWRMKTNVVFERKLSSSSSFGRADVCAGNGAEGSQVCWLLPSFHASQACACAAAPCACLLTSRQLLTSKKNRPLSDSNSALVDGKCQICGGSTHNTCFSSFSLLRRAGDASFSLMNRHSTPPEGELLRNTRPS